MRRRPWLDVVPLAASAGLVVGAGLWSSPLRRHVVVAPVAVIAAIAAGIALIDARTRRVPNRAVVVASIVLFAGALAVTALDHRPGTSTDAGIGLALYAVPLLVVNLRSPGGLGAGDVKLGVVLGGAAGLVHPLAAPLALALGCVLALANRAFESTPRTTAQPFAPALVVAWCAVVVAMPGVVHALRLPWHYH